MKKWLTALGILQLGDLISTLYGCQVLGFEEVNPAMRFLLDVHPVLFAGFKIVFTSIALGLMRNHWHEREMRWAVYISVGLTLLPVLNNLFWIAYVA